MKYHLLLPADEEVGGVVDRDQWNTILQTVSAVNAYRWLYNDGLKPAHVIGSHGDLADGSILGTNL